MELREFVETISDWHAAKVANLRAASDAAKVGTTFDIGGTGKIVATGREALFFRLGVEAALSVLGTLPFKVTKVGEDEDGGDFYDDEDEG